MQTQTKPLETNNVVAQLEKALRDVDNIKGYLKELETTKIGEKILAPIANGIFIETKLESTKLKVNVGNGLVVTKTIEETQKLLDKQRKEVEKSLANAKRAQNV